MLTKQLIKVRELKPGDMERILEIEYRCFPDPYPLSLLNRLYELHPYGFLVAELGGKVVGYVIGAIRWGAEGHILAVAVDPPYRRKGIGSALMANVMDRLSRRGAKHMKLEVRKSNLSGQQFYLKLGFKRRGEIPFYYEDGETAVIMTCEP